MLGSRAVVLAGTSLFEQMQDVDQREDGGRTNHGASLDSGAVPYQGLLHPLQTEDLSNGYFNVGTNTDE